MPPGLVSPDRFPTRDPMDKSQTHGRIINPPRYFELGGLSGPGIWTKGPRPEGFSQSPQSNVARVEKPTSVKSAHKSGRDSE